MSLDSYCLTQALQPIEEHGNITLVVNGIPPQYTRHFISIGLYDDMFGQEFVQPTAGQAVVQVTDDGVQFGSITNDHIDLTKPDYPRPNFYGRAASIKVVAHGIAPVGGESDHYFLKVQVHSYR